jgi:streptogrisin C
MTHTYCTWVAALLFSMSLSATADAAPPERATPAVVAALMQRFDLSREQVLWQLERQEEAARQFDDIRPALGDQYAGAWYVHRTGRATFGYVGPLRPTALARPDVDSVRVQFTQAQLHDWMQRIHVDGAVRKWSRALASSFLDEEANSIVLHVLRPERQNVEAKVRSLLIPSQAIRILTVDQPVAPFANIYGGDGFDNTTVPNSCSIGFAVTGGFLTAAHCAYAGDTITTPSSAALGTVADSTFTDPVIPCTEPTHEDPYPDPCPTSDYAFVETVSGWTPSATVGHGSSNPIAVASDAYGGIVGLYVCRFGASTGGPHCGNVTSYSGSVYHVVNPNNGYLLTPLTVASVCGAFGDSGGPLVNPNFRLAIGMLHGGTLSGCPGNPSQHPTLYSKVPDAISTFGVTLTTQP